jgi:acyl-CoA-binding protein
MASQFEGEAEQRRLGHNGVDVIDELCEASVFDDAARYLTKSSLKLSNDQKLAFYALFKQATVGPCNTPKPSILSMVDRAKWNAWNDIRKLSKDEAIVRYVAELEKISPSWRENAFDADSSDDEEGGKKKGGGGGAGGDGAMIMPQSRPIGEVEVAVADLPEALKDVHLWAKQGDLAQMKARIDKGVSVNARDEEGRTPLHWACDRGHGEMARVLVTQLKADVNAQDSDGATALHYAAANEQRDLIALLLQNGANPNLADESGETAAQAVQGVSGLSDELKALLAKQSKAD